MKKILLWAVLTALAACESEKAAEKTSEGRNISSQHYACPKVSNDLTLLTSDELWKVYYGLVECEVNGDDIISVLDVLISRRDIRARYNKGIILYYSGVAKRPGIELVKSAAEDGYEPAIVAYQNYKLNGAF